MLSTTDVHRVQHLVVAFFANTEPVAAHLKAVLQDRSSAKAANNLWNKPTILLLVFLEDNLSPINIRPQ